MTPKELVQMWNSAAPRQFYEEGVERRGCVAFAILRPLTKEKESIVKEGAKLIGFRVTITMRELVFTKEQRHR